MVVEQVVVEEVVEEHSEIDPANFFNLGLTNHEKRGNSGQKL